MSLLRTRRAEKAQQPSTRSLNGLWHTVAAQVRRGPCNCLITPSDQHLICLGCNGAAMGVITCQGHCLTIQSPPEQTGSSLGSAHTGYSPTAVHSRAVGPSSPEQTKAVLVQLLPGKGPPIWRCSESNQKHLLLILLVEPQVSLAKEVTLGYKQFYAGSASVIPDGPSLSSQSHPQEVNT
jgi:hypothetical protein